jgi:hypothetical protein
VISQNQKQTLLYPHYLFSQTTISRQCNSGRHIRALTSWKTTLPLLPQCQYGLPFCSCWYTNKVGSEMALPIQTQVSSAPNHSTAPNPSTKIVGQLLKLCHDNIPPDSSLSFYICSAIVKSTQTWTLRIPLNKHIHVEKNGVFWDVTPCGSCTNRRFGGIWCLLHQGDKNR